MANKPDSQTVKNANVVSCRPAVWACMALGAEAQQRGVTRSRMAAIALEERYKRPIPPKTEGETDGAGTDA